MCVSVSVCERVCVGVCECECVFFSSSISHEGPCAVRILLLFLTLHLGDRSAPTRSVPVSRGPEAVDQSFTNGPAATPGVRRGEALPARPGYVGSHLCLSLRGELPGRGVCAFVRLTDTNQPPLGGLTQHPPRESAPPHPAGGGGSSSAPSPARWCETGSRSRSNLPFPCCGGDGDLLLDGRPAVWTAPPLAPPTSPRPPPSALPPSLRDASEPLTQSAMSTRICSLDLSSVSGVPFWGPRGFPPQDAPHPTHRLTFCRSYVTTISVGRFPRGPFGLIRGGRV